MSQQRLCQNAKKTARLIDLDHKVNEERRSFSLKVKKNKSLKLT